MYASGSCGPEIYIVYYFYELLSSPEYAELSFLNESALVMFSVHLL